MIFFFSLFMFFCGKANKTKKEKETKQKLFTHKRIVNLRCMAS